MGRLPIQLLQQMAAVTLFSRRSLLLVRSQLLSSVREKHPVAHEQSLTCMRRNESFRIRFPHDDRIPPKVDTVYDADCPKYDKSTNLVATTGAQRDSCDGTVSVARKVMQ